MRQIRRVDMKTYKVILTQLERYEYKVQAESRADAFKKTNTAGIDNWDYVESVMDKDSWDAVEMKGE